MSDVAILAYGAISALGEGAAAADAGTIGSPARVAIARDDELVRAGLARPFAARAPVAENEHRATVLLDRALAACASELDRVRPGWRRERVGLVLGTSSGGMREAERAFAALAAGESVRDAEAATYFGPMARAARSLGRPLEPAMLVLGACASSAIAVGLSVRWLERDACDLVLAGGFDDVTVFVAAGFEVLRATTASPPPRPFRIGRDGMALGEGAAVLALARNGPRAGDAVGARGAPLLVTGFGAASDAGHITAPDREGAGLARAALAALEEAGRPPVDLVSPHATATPFNDPAEARAIVRALGADCQPAPVVHPFKAQIGHTLGAAGALELLACTDAIARGVLPAAAGEGELDPHAPVRLLDRTTAGSPRTALKLAAAFGGANAALVVAAQPAGRTRPRRAAYVGRAAHVDREPPLDALAAATGVAADRLARTDSLVRLALAAVAGIGLDRASAAGTGVVVGSALATVETNAVFAARIREHGARSAEPRRFVYTSPNAAAGECSIAFGLTGPNFATGGGLHAGLEALAAAALLVESGDADRVVVVAVDEGGAVTRALGGSGVRPGAVAVLVGADAATARARVAAVRLARGVPVAGPHPAGHLALVPLTAGRPPPELASSSPPDALAIIALEPIDTSTSLRRIAAGPMTT
jgi:3-oxoacyl-[acyl-carrier-protein] synthase-1/3-oxoacyl-[acyl-carrier-protein] synthase II